MNNVVLAPRPRHPWTGRLHGHHALKALVVAFVLLLAVAVIAPLRRVAAVIGSKIVLTLASPWAPSIGNFADLPEPTKILAADGSPLVTLDGAQRRDPIKLSELPPQVPHAILAAEDANFYRHSGIDPSAVVRAAVRNVQGAAEQGGSTITQQLAKINYTSTKRTWFRKLREVQYAVALENKYSKRQLLERYVNQVYFGDGAYGIAAASQTFFNKQPGQLTAAEAALLAGKIRSPEGLDPVRNPDAVKARRDQVLANMHRHGWLSAADADAAMASPVAVVPEAPAPPTKAPHFVEYVKREAAGLTALGPTPEARGKQLFTGGFTIETTLDPAAFDAAARAVKADLSGPADPATAVVTVKPGDGAITNLFGGLNFDRKFDVASQGRRQPGSAFKPLVYLAALREGIDPRSTLDSTSPKALTYQGSSYTVNNTSDGESSGPISIDDAMVKSINTVFAQLILTVGPENVRQLADALGFANVNDNIGARPAIALGGVHRGVTPLEMAAAYATFAAKGSYARPYSITRITDRRGETVYDHEPVTKQVLDPREVGVLNATLEQVVSRGTATAAQIGRSQAGKTGTTTNFADAWFVGYVPQLSTAVWVGYPDSQKPMDSVHGRRVYGGTFPARIWADYMRVAVANLPTKTLDIATPDQLSLHNLAELPPDAAATTTSSSTTTTGPPPTTTSVDAPSSTTSSSTSSTTTSTPPKKTTTTTSPSTTTTPSTTSTTQKPAGATTTTAPPP